MRWLRPKPSAAGNAAFSAWAFLWLVVLCCAAPSALAQAAAPLKLPPVLTLQDGAEGLPEPPPAREWIDPGGQAGLPQAIARGGDFRPSQPGRIHVLGAEGALWFHLRLVRPPGSHMEWLVEVPLPPVDSVTLYQQDVGGTWRAQTAGDKVAVQSWPEPGRFPVFRLEVPPGEARDVYLRVQHNARSSIPLRVTSAADHGGRMQMAYLGLGMVFGALALLIAACLAQSWVYRDSAFFGYAAYATGIALAMAAYTGAGAHLLWPHSGWIADVAQGSLGLLAAGAAILFVRDLSGIAAQMPRLAATALWTALCAPLLVAVYLVLDRPVGAILLGAYLGLSCLLNMFVAWKSWAGGDKASFWLFAAYVPLGVAVALTLTRVFGLAPPSWANQYGLVAAMAVQVPLLLVALSIHSRERHGAQTRELALSTQDALTGLLAPRLFHDRLRQLVARHHRDRESAAVLFVDLVNHSQIREQHGSAIAEQSLLRAVIKLRRLIRDIDTLSRIGETRFGLILERMGSRVTVIDRAARLVAAGMMPMKGQKPEVSLEFHVAAALLDEVQVSPAELSEGLAALLDTMPRRTRRPIRFLPERDGDSSDLEPEAPGPAAANGLAETRGAAPA